MVNMFKTVKKQNEKDTLLASQTTILEHIERLCAGDLSSSIVLSQEDPLFTIGQGINRLATYYNKLIIDFSLEITQLIQVAVQQGGDLNIIADQFSEQARSVRQLAVATQQVATSVTEIAESTAQTAQQTAQGNHSVTDAIHQVENVSEETKNARDSLELLKERMAELQQAATNIDGLVSAVRNVADQTNLLSLNAAIEAARAGELGRGFSVVASEVRSLSDQSRQSVTEITEQINGVKHHIHEIDQGVKVMNESFQNNVQAVTGASEGIHNLVGIFQNIDEAVGRLAPVTQEQSATFEEMSATLDGVAGSGEHIDKKMYECNKNLFELINKAETIRSSVSNLLLPFSPNDILELAKADHLLWKSRIEYMLKGLVQLDENKVKDHHICRLGKWYFGKGKETFGNLESYRQLDSFHAQFHQCCTQAIQLYKKGDKTDAFHMLEEIDRLSSEVLRLINEMKQVSSK